MANPLTPAPAAHRQTHYTAAPVLDPPIALPLPQLTSSTEQAVDDLSTFGLCLLTDVLTAIEVETLRAKLENQARAERSLGELAPPSARRTKQLVSNMVNKGAEFLSLAERQEADDLAGFMLGKNFLISSITGGIFNGPTTEPQPLHRDQGYVPATADFPAACNLFWLLDDFSAERGSTCIVPGSHRWKPEYQVEPPPKEMAVQIEAPAGSVFAWDGRLWHGTGVNRAGHPRRHVGAFFCLPWMRQQENWGISCLQEVLDEASPKLKARLGLRTYGTLGGVNGTHTDDEVVSLGNSAVSFPEYIIGENGALHPLRRVSRELEADSG